MLGACPSELEAVALTVLPLPRKYTGFSLSFKKSSSSEPSLLPTLLCRLVDFLPGWLLPLLSVLGERTPVLLVVLPLRPRNPNLPYPSCPVPAAGPFVFVLFGFSKGFVVISLGFLEKNPKRGDLLGLDPTAGESLRDGFGPFACAESGVGPRVKVRAVGGGEIAESIFGEGCRDDPLDDSPNRDLRLGDVGVSWEGVRLW